MKVIDLLLDKEALLQELHISEEYYEVEEFNGNNKLKNNKTYQRDQELLNRLDKINNAIHKSDGKTYIEVAGISILVGTAREYLSELEESKKMLEKNISIFDSSINPYRTQENNCRQYVHEKCKRYYAMLDLDNTETDKTVYDIEKEKIDWYIDLKKAIVNSDVVTEID